LTNFKRSFISNSYFY